MYAQRHRTFKDMWTFFRDQKTTNLKRPRIARTWVLASPFRQLTLQRILQSSCWLPLKPAMGFLNDILDFSLPRRSHFVHTSERRSEKLFKIFRGSDYVKPRFASGPARVSRSGPDFVALLRSLRHPRSQCRFIEEDKCFNHFRIGSKWLPDEAWNRRRRQSSVLPR